ncbi:MAG TPA: hypothetical protein PKC87_06305, partial [Candidatus Absconditabacterales bacterium]|nr:hypothetical protein [Candidatus Absconditabacterales bacterium]
IRDNESSTVNFIATWTGIDTIIPTITTGYIYSGSTGYNATKQLYYYKLNPDIKAEVSDNVGLNTGTCMYTINGSSRASASYSGTSTVGYCYKTGIVGGPDLAIRFSIRDTANNTLTGATGSYIYDILPPAVGGGDVDWTWAIRGGGIYYDNANSIAVDSGGNIYIAGYFSGTVPLGSHTIISSGAYDAFVAKLSSTGEYLRAKRGGGISYDDAYGVVVDSGGNVYMAGRFQGTGQFGAYQLISSGSNDAFVAKLSSTGEYLRVKQGGGISDALIESITVDSGGNTYVAGYFSSPTATFGSYPLIASGSFDAFVAKLSSTGEWLRAKRGGGPYYDGIEGVVVDSGGNTYIVGYFSGTAIFGTHAVIASGDNLTFVAKLSSTGEYLRAKRGGGRGNSAWDPASNIGPGIAVDSGGNV